MNLQHEKGRHGIPVASAIVGLVFLVAQDSNAQRSEDIIFTPEKIKTIPGHGMSKGEYPYDEGGTYRTEWVSVSAKSPVSSSVTVRQPIPRDSEEHSNFAAKQRLKETQANSQVSRQTPQKTIGNTNATIQKVAYQNTVPKARVLTELEARNLGYIGPYSKMIVAPSAPSNSFFSKIPSFAKTFSKKATTPVIPPAPAAKKPYHRVEAGDTLFNISRRYGTSVESLKRANGLTSDLIRVGQSLRLAIAQHALGLSKG